MKLLLLTSAILLLASCQQYRYDVRIIPCKQIENLPEKYKGARLVGSISYTGTNDPYIKNNIVYMKNSKGEKQSWGDVCDFSYTRTPISE